MGSAIISKMIVQSTGVLKQSTNLNRICYEVVSLINDFVIQTVLFRPLQFENRR